MSQVALPQDLDQALAALAAPGARAVAGGTDLMIALARARREGDELPATLVELSRVAELERLEPQGRPPLVGAGVTFRRLAQDPELRRRYPILSQAAATVGSVQVRSTATIGGNVANASPAADGVSALVALEARAVVAGPAGIRRPLVSELITGPYTTSLEPGELITGFELDELEPATGQVFAKVGRRRAVAVSRLNLAVVLDAELADPRLVLGSCFPTPRRLGRAEELLTGGDPGPGLWQAAGRAAAAAFAEASGGRASAVYKVPAIKRVAARALADAWQAVGERS